MVGPMVGLSHVAFRSLVRSYLPENFPAVLFTEMLSSRRLPSDRLDLVESLRTTPGEANLVPQILGNEEKFIVPSVEKLMKLNPVGIDINMGCPATQTLKHNWGVLLMGDKAYAKEVVSITKKASPVPVSVKLRAGENIDDKEYLLNFTEALEKGGADWLTIHARSREQRHNGVANWDLVSEISKERSIPIVVNGDVQTYQDALSLFENLSVDGVMVGRAACARPWILAQIASKLGIEVETPPFSLEEEGAAYFESCLRYCDLLVSFYGDTDKTLRKLHFYLSFGSKWFLFGHNFWRLTMKCKTISQAKETIADYSAEFPQAMRERITFS